MCVCVCQISDLVAARKATVSFNTSWLENLYEEQIFQTSGERVTPLVSNPGRIMLTASRLYFQPYNNVEVEPVLKLALSELQLLLKRRYLLRHVVGYLWVWSMLQAHVHMYLVSMWL